MSPTTSPSSTTPTSTSTSKTAERGSARERLLAAANELFYDEGVHTVGIDRVIERAGVAKASLYNTFGSKEELIREYLAVRHSIRTQRITRGIEQHTDPRERLLAVYDVLGDVISEPTFRGCAFINARAESAPDGKVGQMCDLSRSWTRALFVDLARAAGAPEPEQLAVQLHLLYDGALVAAQMDGNQTSAVAARAAAGTLLDAALAG